MSVPRWWGYSIGALIALAVPWELRGGGIATLVQDAGLPARGRRDPTDALRAARRMLRILARARLPWWRNTCLYRAVAECLVLRHYGIPSRVRLGVARPGDGFPIAAHAWVAHGTADAGATAGTHVVLR